MVQYYLQLRDRGIATGWFRLDKADNDVDRFLAYLVEAFRAIDTAIPSALGRYDGAVANDTHGAMLDLAGHLAAFEGEFVLFLDDFEVIESPVVLGLVRQFIDVLPAGGRLVIGSRTVPDLGLGRLRAHGQLVEIETPQLRFSSAETAAFLRQQRGLALRDDDILRLQHRTEGWPAALWLVSLALRDRSDPHRFVETFDGSNASIADYLVEDVLARQAEPVRRFLLGTSVLQELSAPLCDHLLQRGDSHELLAQIERAHLFLVPQDSERHWYRYHALFSGFLRDQLRQSAPQEVHGLHQRAAQWWAGHGKPTRAIEHALQCGDGDYLMALLQAHANDLLWLGRTRTLARWHAAPAVAARLAQHPALMLIFGWALTLAHRYDESLKLLDTLQAGLAAGTLGEQDVPAVAISVQRAFILAMQDRVKESAELWHVCTPRVTPAQPFSYAMLGASYGFCLVAESRFAEARGFLEQARRRVQEIGDSFIAPMALCLEGAIDFAQGHLRNATSGFRAALAGGGAALLPQAANNTVAAAFLAEALYEANALDEAERLLNIYLPLLKDAAAPDQLITSFAVLARIACARGHQSRADELLDEMEVVGHRHGLPRMVATARLERSRVALLRGEVVAAQNQLASGCDERTWQPLGGLVTHANDTEAPAIAQFRLRIRTGRAEATLAPLKQALKEADALQRHRRALKLSILLAEALCATGQTAAGLRRLRDAVQFAAGEGFVRSFVDEGPMLMRWVGELQDSLAEAHGGDAGLAGFVARLLAAGGVSPQRPAGQPPASTAPTSAGVLSERELQVLRLLTGGHRNRAIAERLFVSETTVKAHLRSINVKLGTESRTHAIAVARQRGLLD
ncbi:LuxR C-terminal-related transcriptional regulator [Pseudorhodoferax soli]|uniref:LuxR family maltose regulon positive regulatory protein n=1 Tax=Pseudorhodoferax soli TaxID=545864 RepID=A0A368XSB4_9BURK|nr:LuxR C-terminal-related transcriptional regulator [Pseudorhodoferax soli]RCW69427.1 LuxR family maltose regulon positive regulatory protein [Pseudorhodoferax soli]